VGKKSASLRRTQTGPAPGPPPKWGVRSVGVKKQTTTDGAQIVYHNGVVLAVHSLQPGVVLYLTETGVDPRDANAQRVQVKDSYELPVRRSPTVKLVNQGTEGNYGPAVILSFINEDVKYKAQEASQQRLLEPEFKFIFP